jgi:hypothetical protein
MNENLKLTAVNGSSTVITIVNSNVIYPYITCTAVTKGVVNWCIMYDKSEHSTHVILLNIILHQAIDRCHIWTMITAYVLNGNSYGIKVLG